MARASLTTPRASLTPRGGPGAFPMRGPSLQQNRSSVTAAGLGLVRAMKSAGLAEKESWTSTTPRLSQTLQVGNESEDGSDDNKSVCSGASSSMNSSLNGNGKRRTRTGSRTLHMSFDGGCSVDVEAEDDMSNMSALTDFSQLGGDSSHGDGLVQCLQMYGYTAPNKMQGRLVPTLMQQMGRQLGGIGNACAKGKSCTLVQGGAKCGKTSSVVMSVLASIDPSLEMPQAILLSSSPQLDIDKYLRVFTLMQTVTCATFHWEEGRADGGAVDEASQEVRAARSAHILVGHPRRMLKLISSVPSLCLDAVKLIVLDDAEDFLMSSEAELPGQPATGTSPMEDYVQLGSIVECRRYSQNMSSTVSIRAGDSLGHSVRHVIVLRGSQDQGIKKVVRLLKNSLMKKKGGGASSMPSAPPAKLIKSMKHYFATAPRTEWSRVFAGLVQSLLFPRALIFCDGDAIGQHAKELQDVGMTVSANAPNIRPGENAADARRRAVQEFTSGKTQFLLTTSEHAICQVVLPKVSCVFHFGVPTDVPSTYGLRLMPIDPKARHQSSSILLVEPTKKPVPAMVSTLGKLFDIGFTDMPWEFLPTTGKKFDMSGVQSGDA